MTFHKHIAAMVLALFAAGSVAVSQEPEPAPEPPGEPVQEEAAPVDEPLVEEERERIELFDETVSFAERLFDGYWDRELFTYGEDVWHLGDLIRGATILGVALALMLFLRYALMFAVIRRLERGAKASPIVWDDALLAIWHSTKGWILFALAIYLGLRTLPLPSIVAVILDALMLLLALVQAAIWASAAFLTAIDKTRERRAAKDPSAASAFGLLALAGRVLIWSAVLLLALDNLGFDVTALIAGLGVGGIAIAFALQSILGDIFCSVAILLDKPFVVGDFIVVGDMLGNVERIGIKTTRIRSLSGEQIVFSNQDLLSSRIRNYKRMYERRVLFSFGVVYETPSEKLERIPGMVQEIIEGLEQTRFDRAHFQKFGDSSLDFEIVYYVLVPEYNVFMDRQQQVNFTLKRRFEQEGIDFAYPTQELIVRPNQTPESTD